MNHEATKTTKGSFIYYTGDAANCDGWFSVIEETRDDWGHYFTLAELSGVRVFKGVHAHHIGQRYSGHCSPRFVTEAAYRAFYDLGAAA